MPPAFLDCLEIFAVEAQPVDLPDLDRDEEDWPGLDDTFGFLSGLLR
ncbi:hypothetical protein [Streptomyces sp. NBC_00328]|nr:hypothetical protein [Streptomyces sp. NBC_00328]